MKLKCQTPFFLLLQSRALATLLTMGSLSSFAAGQSGTWSGTTKPRTWSIPNNGVSANNLIFAVTSPTISVNTLDAGKKATVSADIRKSVGLPYFCSSTNAVHDAGNLSLSALSCVCMTRHQS
jgi:hypothetical protein